MHNVIRNEKATEEATGIKKALALPEISGGALIRDGAVVENDYTLVDSAEVPTVGHLPSANLILPYAFWQENRDAILKHAHDEKIKIGVWITGALDPKLLEPDVPFLALIAIKFEKFADGRGYSSAALLRSRYGFKGELRAIGDVLRDQIFYMKRAGFTSYQIRADKSAEAALASFQDFSMAYQQTAGDVASITPARSVLAPARNTPDLNAKVADLKALLRRIETDFSPAVFANSYGAEDMVLMDLIAKDFPKIQMFSLNTGRLPKETLALAEQAAARYGVAVQEYIPNAAAVADYISASGLNGFYESVEARKSCCHIRKVEPLHRALAGKKAWLTGMRREQADSRQALEIQNTDTSHGLEKFNPLLDWTSADVWAYLRANDVPYNALHDRGYPSIGCEPCTRAVKVGEHPRAGRWWWENSESGQQECGLHVAENNVSVLKHFPQVGQKFNEQKS
jgi:phosphoadenosine phosphosulfate reductase